MLGRSPKARRVRPDRTAEKRRLKHEAILQSGTWVDVTVGTLGENAERKTGPSLMRDQTVNENLVTNDKVRPDTSILSDKSLSWT